MLASSFPYFQKNGMMARIYSKWFSWHGLSLGKHPHFHGMKIAFVFALHGWYDFFFRHGPTIPQGNRCVSHVSSLAPGLGVSGTGVYLQL